MNMQAIEWSERHNCYRPVGLRMARGFGGTLRAEIEGLILDLEYGLPAETNLYTDEYHYGKSEVVARWNGQEIWLHRYNHGERMAGYPPARLTIGNHKYD